MNDLIGLRDSIDNRYRETLVGKRRMMTRRDRPKFMLGDLHCEIDPRISCENAPVSKRKRVKSKHRPLIHVNRDDERFDALWAIVGDCEGATLEEVSTGLHDYRTSCDEPCDTLTDEEGALLAITLEEALPIVRRVASRYYAHRTQNVADAVEWLTAEMTDYVVRGVIRGRCAVPFDIRGWVQSAKLIRRRYWKANSLIVDGTSCEFFADDADFESRVKRARLQLDNLEFMCQLAQWYSDGTNGSLPDWTLATLGAIVDYPDATGQELAHHCGVTYQTWRTRWRRLKDGIRAGSVGALFA